MTGGKTHPASGTDRRRAYRVYLTDVKKPMPAYERPGVTPGLLGRLLLWWRGRGRHV